MEPDPKQEELWEQIEQLAAKATAMNPIPEGRRWKAYGRQHGRLMAAYLARQLTQEDVDIFDATILALNTPITDHEPAEEQL